MSRRWFKRWKLALLRPSVASFREIAQDPTATMRDAILSAFLSAAVSLLISLLVSLLLSRLGLEEFEGIWDPADSQLFLLAFYVLMPLMAGALAVGALLLIAALAQAFARMLGGVGKVNEITPAMAAFITPLISLRLLTVGLGAFIGFFGPFLLLYGVILGAIAIEAVNRIGWSKTLASTMATLLVIFALIRLIDAAFAGSAPR